MLIDAKIIENKFCKTVKELESFLLRKKKGENNNGIASKYASRKLEVTTLSNFY